MKTVDARGISCPQPVLLTKQALADKPAELTVLVDNATARGNVQRFAGNQGYQVEIREEGGEYSLLLHK